MHQKFNIKAARGFLRELAEDWRTGIEDGTYEDDLKPKLAELDALIAAPAQIVIPKEKRTYPQCTSCGGFDVYADAYADWNPKTGDYDQVRVAFDQKYCEGCGGECSVEEVDHATFTDLQQLAQDEASEARGLAMMEGRLDDL